VTIYLVGRSLSGLVEWWCCCPAGRDAAGMQQRLLLCPHHKTGTFLSIEFAQVLRAHTNITVTPGSGCAAWDKAGGKLRADYRLVNFVRDPFEWVVSNALYDLRGDETKRYNGLYNTEQIKLRTGKAFGGVTWPPVDVLPTFSQRPCAGSSSCVEPYWAYLSRLRSDARFGSAAVILVTALLLATGPPRIGDFDSGRSRLDELSRSARLAAQDHPRSINVCLDHFMSPDAVEAERTWHALLDVIGLAEAPRELRARIVARMLSNGATKQRHATAGTEARALGERLELLRLAREADARYVGGAYTRLAALVNCSASGRM